VATVPTYFRDKLVSSRTGINTLDNSAAEMARSIGKMASSFQDLAARVYQKERAQALKSESAKKQAQYINASSSASKEIMEQYAEDPEAGYEALQLKSNEIKDNILDGIEDSKLQRDLTPMLDGLVAQQSVNNRKWQLNQTQALDQQFLIDVQQTNVNTVLQGATQEEYNIMMGDDTFTRENYIRAWGVAEGTKNFVTAQNGMFRARAATIMEEGRFFEAQDFIEKTPGYDPVTGRGGPDEKTRAEVKENFLKMQRGATARALFQTQSAASFDVVETQEKLLLDDVSAAELDDRVMQVSAEAASAVPGSEQQKVLTQYTKVLADIRDMKMENTLLNAPGNTDVEASIQSKYEQLFVREDGIVKVDKGGFLEDFLGFQAQIVSEAKKGNISYKNYNKWMFWSKVALDGYEINKNKMTKDKGMRKTLKNFLKESRKQKKSDQWSMNVLSSIYERVPVEQLDQLEDEVVKNLFTQGKIAATLQEMGFPIDMIDAKIIRTSAGVFPVAGFDPEDGMPILEIPTEAIGR